MCIFTKVSIDLQLRFSTAFEHCAKIRKVADSIPIMSLKFVIDIMLPVALWPWG